MESNPRDEWKKSRPDGRIVKNTIERRNDGATVTADSGGN
jgi:hypothetical protein